MLNKILMLIVIFFFLLKFRNTLAEDSLSFLAMNFGEFKETQPLGLLRAQRMKALVSQAWLHEFDPQISFNDSRRELIPRNYTGTSQNYKDFVYKIDITFIAFIMPYCIWIFESIDIIWEKKVFFRVFLQL